MTTTDTPAKPKVKIVFDGVMTVGPGHPDKGGTRPGPFFGVMAQATRRLSQRTQRLAREALQNEVPMSEPPLYNPMHIPTIFTLLEPAADSRPPDQVLQLSPFHPKWYLWHPIRERLEFRFDGNGEEGQLSYYRGQPIDIIGHVQFPDEPIKLNSIESVPDLRTIFPARSVLDDGLLSDKPGVDRRVAAQVFVPYGLVAGAGTMERGELLDIVFEPDRSDDRERGAAARKLVPNAAVVVPAYDIEIASFSLDTGEALDSIKLRASADAEIFVSNGDPSDVEVDREKLAMQIVDKLVAGKKIDDKLAAETNRFAQNFGRQGHDLHAEAMQVVAYHHGGRLAVFGELAKNRTPVKVDVDFEIYYSLMKGRDDGQGLPAPRRADGKDLDEPNCFVCLSETRDKITLHPRAVRGLH